MRRLRRIKLPEMAFGSTYCALPIKAAPKMFPPLRVLTRGDDNSSGDEGNSMTDLDSTTMESNIYNRTREQHCKPIMVSVVDSCRMPGTLVLRGKQQMVIVATAIR